MTLFSALALSKIGQLCFPCGKNLFHILAENRVADSYEAMKKLLEASTVDIRNQFLSAHDFAGRTPLQLANTYKLRQLLEWSDSQEGFYYLQTPPVVLVMYSTENRDGAEQESQDLERVISEFKLDVCTKVNPSKDEMTSAILDSVASHDVVSALIVIIMSHGAQGVICASDGDVRIQDILLQMQGAIPDGRPKVR